MRFSVDGWDPSYGASLELEGQLEEVHRADRRRRGAARRPVAAGRPRPGGPAPRGAALRRRRAPRRGAALDRRRRPARRRTAGDAQPADAQPGGPRPAAAVRRPSVRRAAWSGGEPTAALCASYAAGVVCCCAAGAHLVTAKLRRGLFSVAPHASDIRTRAGEYRAHHVLVKRAGAPVMTTLSQALQGKLAEVEAIAATEARGAAGDAVGPRAPGGHRRRPADRRRAAARPPAPAPRPRLHQVAPHDVPAAGAERTRPHPRTRPAHPGLPSWTSWERHSWYLRLPGPAGLAVGRRGARRMRCRPAYQPR